MVCCQATPQCQVQHELARCADCGLWLCPAHRYELDRPQLSESPSLCFGHALDYMFIGIDPRLPFGRTPFYREHFLDYQSLAS